MGKKHTLNQLHAMAKHSGRYPVQISGGSNHPSLTAPRRTVQRTMDTSSDGSQSSTCSITLGTRRSRWCSFGHKAHTLVRYRPGTARPPVQRSQGLNDSCNCRTLLSSDKHGLLWSFCPRSMENPHVESHRLFELPMLSNGRGLLAWGASVCPGPDHLLVFCETPWWVLSHCLLATGPGVNC